MNRVRLAMLAGVLGFGGLGLGSSSAQAQYMGGTTAAVSPYTAAGGGYYGGYYYAPQAAPSYYGYAPRYSTPAYRAPARGVGRARSYSNYDPSGRHDNLARPWLKPLR